MVKMWFVGHDNEHMLLSLSVTITGEKKTTWWGKRDDDDDDEEEEDGTRQG